MTSWRNFNAAGVFCEQAALTHAAVQLATASLHPDLANVGYFTSNPAFARLDIGAEALTPLMGRFDAVRAFVAQL